MSGKFDQVDAPNSFEMDKATINTLTPSEGVKVSGDKDANKIGTVKAEAAKTVTLGVGVERVEAPAGALINVIGAIIKSIVAAGDVTVGGSGTVASVDFNQAGSVNVSTDTDTTVVVNQVTVVNININVTQITIGDNVKDQSGNDLKVKTKAPRPVATFEAADTLNGDGKINGVEAGMRYSKDGGDAMSVYLDSDGTMAGKQGSSYAIWRPADETYELPSDPISGYIPKNVAINQAVISGSPVFGQTLKASANNDATDTWEYKWYVSGSNNPIKTGSAETGLTLTLPIGSDANEQPYAGKTITVEISNYDDSPAVASPPRLPFLPIWLSIIRQSKTRQRQSLV